MKNETIIQIQIPKETEEILKLLEELGKQIQRLKINEDDIQN